MGKIDYDFNEIRDLESEEFEKVHSIIKEIGVEERHFNDLSSKYKTLASTWLLATFGGIGFILTNESIAEKQLFIAGIGFAGAIGIYLLWLIDLRVYQQLLYSNFIEGRDLELEFSWLPPIRQNMMATQGTGRAITNLSWYYILGTNIPFLIGAFILSNFIFSYGWLWASLFIFTVSVFCVWFTKMLIDKSNEDFRGSNVISEGDQVSTKKIPNSIFWLYGLVLILSFGLFNFNEIRGIPHFTTNQMDSKTNQDIGKNKPQTLRLKEEYDYLAPDGSEIRLLPEMSRGSFAHCVLPAYQTSKAVVHKTVDEIWYVLEGNGMIWRKNSEGESVDGLSAGVSITIPVGTHFQFRNIGKDPLKIVISTMPPWPQDEEEAVPVKGYWE